MFLTKGQVRRLRAEATEAYREGIVAYAGGRASGYHTKALAIAFQAGLKDARKGRVSDQHYLPPKVWRDVLAEAIYRWAQY